MKLIVEYDKPLTGNQRLFPRDIRNYIGSISSEADKEFTMWHKKEASHIIYTQPNRNSFAIISYVEDEATKALFERIKANIQKNSQLSFREGNIKVNVLEVFVVAQKISRLTPQFEERTLRTPMLIMEYARARQLSENDTIDMPKLEKLAVDTIKSSIDYMYKSWGAEAPDLEDLMIVCKDLKYFPLKYKEGQYFPAVLGTFISNKKLPDFIGYKVGLGYGELARKKNIERRGKK